MARVGAMGIRTTWPCNSLDFRAHEARLVPTMPTCWWSAAGHAKHCSALDQTASSS